MAILLVLWAHQGNVFYADPDAYLRGGLFYFGIWGVPIFFGLSGLLITKLLLEEHELTGAIHWKGFYIRRCFRILPPMILYLGLVAALGFLHSGAEFWSCIFFFRNYLPWQLGSWYSGHLWSLAVEEHFYLFWPALLLGSGVRKGWIPALALSFLCAVWRWFDVFPGNDARTDLRLDSLLLGAVLAFALHSKRGNELVARLLSPAAWTLVLGMLFASIRAGLTFPASGLIPTLIAGTVTHPEWPVSRGLELRPVRWLGRISYSLYLWQQVFLYPPWQPTAPMWIRHAGIQRFPFSLGCAFLCAVASYYAVERPLIRVGRALAGQAR